MSSGASEQQPAGTPKSEATRRSILDGAKASFAAKGYSGTTVADITQQSRVTRAGFYYYFRDKRESFPPECERMPGRDYTEGARRYHLAEPVR